LDLVLETPTLTAQSFTPSVASEAATFDYTCYCAGRCILLPPILSDNAATVGSGTLSLWEFEFVWTIDPCSSLTYSLVDTGLDPLEADYLSIVNENLVMINANYHNLEASSY